ncbi:GNAT family N-acetyltransferase [uncultured Modestobacter sp.]|uniref:GNAT family N-acetyltransferase n=1 Tax=uncultured Modestobacter sp. TaxID=380048 RepID=UPI0026163F62|nr:GNAT family N-acetyltransferase [uncultured Modestobacter sp.]
MTISRVERLTEADVAQLRGLDASFITDTVLKVDQDSAGFRLREEAVHPPYQKRYRLSADLQVGAQPPWGQLFVARRKGAIVAVAATTHLGWNGRQRLDELHVAPAHRGSGLGGALVGQVHEEAVQNQAREIWVETQHVNLPAIRAYRRLGFRVTGVDVSRYASRHDGEVAVFLSRDVDARSGTS